MEIKERHIGQGIYLVIDPSADHQVIPDKLKRILKHPVAAVQLWDHFPDGIDIHPFISQVTEICHAANVPVFINNRWERIRDTALDGVHFDQIPAGYEAIKKKLSRPFMAGITCNNDLSIVQWADANGLDYISFCSLFPSSTANSCELVSFENIKKTRELTQLPIFLAGGIRPDNIYKLDELPYSGIAVVSGIMSAEDPEQAIKNYSEQLQSKKNAR